VLNVGSADVGCTLGSQGHHFAAAVLEDVHLLLDDVGGLADAADEEAGLLEYGRVDARVAIELAEAGSRLVDVLPVGLLLGQDVDRSPWGSLKRTHRPENTKWALAL